jgi:hypothetical protein
MSSEGGKRFYEPRHIYEFLQKEEGRSVLAGEQRVYVSSNTYLSSRQELPMN